MIVSPRAAPHELRVSIDALGQLPWSQTAHLAIVDSVGPGWDTGARYIGALARIGKARALEAGRANIEAGVYTNIRTERKRIRDGRVFDATFFTVSTQWTTRPGKRPEDRRFVRLDTRFLDAHPRLSDLGKTLYHFLAAEQMLYGGCALTPAQIASELRVERSASHTAADRISQAIRKLVKKGEAVKHEDGVVTVPFYNYAQADLERLRPDARRASFAAAGRAEIAHRTLLHSEPHPPPLGTATPSTRNRPKKKKEEERLKTSALLRTHTRAHARGNAETAEKPTLKMKELSPSDSETPDPKSGPAVRDGKSKSAVRRKGSSGSDRPSCGSAGRHTMNEDWFSLHFAYRDEQERDDLLEMLKGLEQRYGADEARCIFRAHCLDLMNHESKPRITAKLLLDFLSRRFFNLDPRNLRAYQETTPAWRDELRALVS